MSIDKEKVREWKKHIDHAKEYYGYITESDNLLLQFCDQYLSGKLVEPMSAEEIDDIAPLIFNILIPHFKDDKLNKEISKKIAEAILGRINR